MLNLALLQTLAAGAIGVACLLLLAHQCIPAPRRHRLDARAMRGGRVLRAWGRRLLRWPATRHRARREADAAIRRARETAGDWDGNVYRPKSFSKPRKLH